MQRKSLVLTFAVVILLAGLAVGLAARPAAFALLRRKTAHRFPEVHWIASGYLARWLADSIRPRPLLLDARTEDEYGVSHLKFAQRINPYRPLLSDLQAVPRDTQVVVYSSAGYRSARVAYWLGQQGFARVLNLDGGIFRWVNDGRPVVRNEIPASTVHPFNARWGLLLQGQYRADLPDLEKHSAAP